ncbi:MAG: hypothetical protein PHC51_03615 [bacterium]|nr:hypothetical protein [bacterium]
MSFESWVEELLDDSQDAREKERIATMGQHGGGTTDPGCSTVLVGSKEPPDQQRGMDK